MQLLNLEDISPIQNNLIVELIPPRDSSEFRSRKTGDRAEVEEVNGSDGGADYYGYGGDGDSPH